MLAQSVPEPVRPWLSFTLGPVPFAKHFTKGTDPVVKLAGCINGWLGAPEDLRAATREAIVAT